MTEAPKEKDFGTHDEWIRACVEWLKNKVLDDVFQNFCSTDKVEYDPFSMYDQNCSKCGAPYSYPNMWHGITPPSPNPTCHCWNTADFFTTTSTDFIVEGNGSGCDE